MFLPPWSMWFWLYLHFLQNLQRFNLWRNLNCLFPCFSYLFIQKSRSLLPVPPFPKAICHHVANKGLDRLLQFSKLSPSTPSKDSQYGIPSAHIRNWSWWLAVMQISWPPDLSCQVLTDHQDATTMTPVLVLCLGLGSAWYLGPTLLGVSIFTCTGASKESHIVTWAAGKRRRDNWPSCGLGWLLSVVAALGKLRPRDCYGLCNELSLQCETASQTKQRNKKYPPNQSK